MWSRSHLWHASRAYWLCQAAGWSAFAAVRVAAAFAVAVPAVETVVLQLTAAALGFGVTHALRAVLLARGWTQLGWRALAPRMVVAAPVASLVWSVLVWPVSRWATAGFSDSIDAAKVFVLVLVNQGLFLCAWLGLYLGYQAFRRSQRNEVERLRLERAVVQAELRALKSQVNPHFLFNSLNTVRALIDEDPARAREAVTQLANLLRAALQAGARETVALRSELQTVQAYLALEKLRHEDRLRFVFEIEPEAASEVVPPMLVQTLVENAVKYGVGGSAGGTEVRVRARTSPAGLELHVTNTGHLRRPGEGGTASTGVGLRNAEERLQLLFGGAARLRLHEEEPGLVVAEVSIPRRGDNPRPEARMPHDDAQPSPVVARRNGPD